MSLAAQRSRRRRGTHRDPRRALDVALLVANVFTPQKQGLDAIRELRAHGAALPIVALVPSPDARGAGATELRRDTQARDLAALAREAGATQVCEWPLEWETLRVEVQATLTS